MAKGAPVGNQFWKLRSKHGRDRLFETHAILWDAACEYFQWCDDNPFYEVEQSRGPNKPHVDDEGNVTFPPNLVELPKMRPYTMQGLCLYLDCNTLYFNDFEKALKDKQDEVSKDFSLIVTRIIEVIYNQKFSGAASGFLNPNIIARDLGLSDKSELTGRNGAPLTGPAVIIKMPDGTSIDFPSNTDGDE